MLTCSILCQVFIQFSITTCTLVCKASFRKSWELRYRHTLCIYWCHDSSEMVITEKNTDAIVVMIIMSFLFFKDPKPGCKMYVGKIYWIIEQNIFWGKCRLISLRPVSFVKIVLDIWQRVPFQALFDIPNQPKALDNLQRRPRTHIMKTSSAPIYYILNFSNWVLSSCIVISYLMQLISGPQVESMFSELNWATFSLTKGHEWRWRRIMLNTW